MLTEVRREAQEGSIQSGPVWSPCPPSRPHSSHRTEYLVQEPSRHTGPARPAFGTGLGFESLPLPCLCSQAYFGDPENRTLGCFRSRLMTWGFSGPEVRDTCV